MKVRNAFRCKADFIHLLVGVIVKVAKFYGYGIWSIVIFIIYLLYQAVEKEVEVESYKDYIEFILGYLLAEVIL